MERGDCGGKGLLCGGGDHMNEDRAGLGYQDFEEVREKHIFYIDKTDFIREWWENVGKDTYVVG